MNLFQRDNRPAHEIEWENVCQREEKFVESHQTRGESKLNQMLQDKVPDKMQATLDAAFAKAFYIVFEKGTEVIEKTYNKEKLENEHKVEKYRDEVYGDTKSLRRLAKKAGKGELLNVVLSGASGISMGLAGVGLPDIPVFTGIMLKSIYEIALNYGYSYESEEEKYFILLLIEGAVSYGDEFNEANQKIDAFIKSEQAPEEIAISEQIAQASSGLSKELLYMKFIQGIPIVGSIGGAYDVAYIKRISEYARIKYQKRYLMRYHEVQDVDDEPIV